VSAATVDVLVLGLSRVLDAVSAIGAVEVEASRTRDELASDSERGEDVAST
jgi:hypothetical protein